MASTLHSKRSEGEKTNVAKRLLALAVMISGVVSLSTAGLLGALAPRVGAASLATWSSSGSVATAVSQPTSVALANGNVLVAGGLSGSGATSAPIAGASIFSPTTGTFSATGSLATPRYGATSDLLGDTTVLGAGGVTGSGAAAAATASAELYSPQSGTFSTVSPLPTAVFGASSVVLPNGNVLVAGGETGTVASPAPTTAVALYNPTTKSWTTASPLTTARGFATVTLLVNGSVLVAGGNGAGGLALNSAELYNPSTNTWAPAGTLTVARADATATLLPSGNVLVAGGQDSTGAALASTELYSTSTNTWTTTGSLTTARTDASASLLPSGEVLVVGGQTTLGTSLSSSELFDADSGTWSATGALTTARSQATLDFLPATDTVVIIGGTGSAAPLASAELYDAGAPPGFSPTSSASFAFGVNSSFTIQVNGTPAPTLTEVGTLPSGLTFTAGTSGKATISGSPTGSPGTFYVQIFESNGIGQPNVEWFGVIVKPAAAPGYLLASASGAVFAEGQSTAGTAVSVNANVRPVVAIVGNPSGGYYLVTARGNVYNKNGAPFFGSKAAAHLASPVAAFAVAPDGLGYWMVLRNGTVYPFGEAVAYSHLSVNIRTRPVVAMAPSPSGRGYYLVTSIGNVFNYGDAGFYGSKASKPLPHPVVAFAATPDGKGYWIVTSGGNIYNIGDAGFSGSKARAKLVQPISAFAATIDGKGYYLTDTAGSVSAFGDAPVYGSPATSTVTSPIRGMTISS